MCTRVRDLILILPQCPSPTFGSDKENPYYSEIGSSCPCLRFAKDTVCVFWRKIKSRYQRLEECGEEESVLVK